MEQTGYIVEVKTDSVKVRVDRESACGGNCVSCNGCPTSAVIVECKTADKYRLGEEVTLYMQNKQFYKTAFLGYGLMTVLAVTGAIVLYKIISTELASVIGAGLGIFLGIFITKPIFNNKDTKIIIKRKG